jgi:hypothetical protein
LSEGDVHAVDLECERWSWRLTGVDAIVWEFISAEFGVGEIQFEDGCECGYQVSLLLEAGDGAADREEVVCICNCLCQGIRDVTALDGQSSEEDVVYRVPSKWAGYVPLRDSTFGWE